MCNRDTLRLTTIIARRPRPRIYPPTLNVHSGQDRQRRPKHSDEEQKRISDIAGPISDEADDQRADKRGRLKMDGVSVCVAPSLRDTQVLPCR